MSYIKEIRKHVGSTRVFVPGVRAIIIDGDGKILLQHRKDNSLWGLPGGSVELDETALEAIKREVKEETSLEVFEAEPMGLYCGPSQKFSYPGGDLVQCFAIAFIIRKWKGQPNADGVEGSMVRFFSTSELPENIVPVHIQTLEDYKAYKGDFLLSG